MNSNNDEMEKAAGKIIVLKDTTIYFTHVYARFNYALYLNELSNLL